MTMRVSVRAKERRAPHNITTPKIPDPLFPTWIIRQG